MAAAGFERASAENPYWNRLGQTWLDPDGYHVVLQHESWPA
jgi:hypothetical protein